MARDNCFCAAEENNVVFAGGSSNRTPCANAEGYDENLTRTTLAPLSVAKHRAGSAAPKSGGNIGGYMIFAGGLSAAGVESSAEAYTLV